MIMKIRLKIFLCSVLLFIASFNSVSAADGCLYTYYGGKLGLSILLAGTAITDPDAGGIERAVAGGASLIAGVPAYAVIYHARRGDAAAVQKWRKISFAADMTLSAGLASYGIYLISSSGSGSSRQYAGLSAVTAGLAGAVFSMINRIPFSLEGRDNAVISGYN